MKGLSRLSLFKLIVLFLSSAVMIHRIYAHYEGHRTFVHAPIHKIKRTCPEPLYPLLESTPITKQEDIKEKEETKEEEKEAAKVESPKPVQEAKMEGVEEAVVDEKQPTIEKVEETSGRLR